jgi:cytochrome P450
MFGMRTMAWMKADVLAAYMQLQREYGDTVTFKTGPYRLFICFHPDQVREVLVTQAKSFVRFPRVMQTFSQWNGRSILIVEGEDWVRQRRLVQPAFQPRRFEEYGRTMVDVTRRMIDSWQPEFDRAGHVDVEINRAMTSLTLEIICKVLFDADVRDESSEIARAVATLSEVAFHEMQAPVRMPKWWPTTFHRRKRAAIRTLDDAVWRIVRQRRAEGRDHGDLLSILLTSVDEEGDGGRLDDRQVRDEAMTLMLAGHDTSAAALDWFWYNIARFPDVAARCRAEIDSVLNGRRPAAADVPRLKFVEATIKETLRLYPPAIGIFLRQATTDVRIGGYDVAKGELVTLSSFVTQRDPRWFAEPERFDPERFLPPRAESIVPGAYFPFGAGPRVCIGQSFAMTEMVLVAATIVQLCDVTLAPGASEPQLHVHMALRPKHDLILRWRRRAIG